MNDNFKMYGLIGSEIKNSVSTISQDGVDCKRSIFPESFCMLCKALFDQDFIDLKINRHGRIKVLRNKTTIPPSCFVLFYLPLKYQNTRK